MDYIEFLQRKNVLKKFIRELDYVIDYYNENGSFQDINENDMYYVLHWEEKPNRLVLVQVKFIDITPDIVAIQLNTTYDNRYVVDEVEDTEFTIEDLIEFRNQLEIERIMSEQLRPELGRL